MFSQAQPLSSANSRGDCRRPASWDVLRFVGTVGATLLTAHRVPPRIESSAGELLEEIGAQLVSVRTWLSSSLRLSIGHLAGKQSPAPSWTSRAAGPTARGQRRLLSALVPARPPTATQASTGCLNFAAQKHSSAFAASSSGLVVSSVRNFSSHARMCTCP